MTNLGKLALSLLALPTMLLASSSAMALNVPPECGKFITDDAAFADCKVVTTGGCDAQCTPIKFIAGCTGGCTATASTSCSNTTNGTCGAQCMKDCNPAQLDCVSGCLSECKQPFIDSCTSKHPERDCVVDADASCTDYCRNTCKVPPASGCEDHCNTCCTGACTSNINLDCDIACYAKLEGGCKVQCEAPSGAIFCNGQYVNATDPQSCINALIAQGVEVDVSARGECTITLGGADCDGTANAGGFGCSAQPGSDSPFAPVIVGMGLAAAAISVSRRRNRKSA